MHPCIPYIVSFFYPQNPWGKLTWMWQIIKFIVNSFIDSLFPISIFVSSRLNRNTWRIFPIQSTAKKNGFSHDLPLEIRQFFMVFHSFFPIFLYIGIFHSCFPYVFTYFQIFSRILRGFSFLFPWKNRKIPAFSHGKPPTDLPGDLDRSTPPQPSRWSGRSC